MTENMPGWDPLLASKRLAKKRRPVSGAVAA
jgi:hypothetical protein